MSWFRGNFTKTIKNVARVSELKSRVWAMTTRNECVVDYIEGKKEQEDRLKDLLEEGVDTKTAFEAALEEINQFKI